MMVAIDNAMQALKSTLVSTEDGGFFSSFFFNGLLFQCVLFQCVQGSIIQ